MKKAIRRNPGEPTTSCAYKLSCLDERERWETWVIQEFRTQIGHIIHNYFPTIGTGINFHQGRTRRARSFTVNTSTRCTKRYARRHFENRLEALKKEYHHRLDLDENTKLLTRLFGRVLTPGGDGAGDQRGFCPKVSGQGAGDRIAEVLYESVADDEVVGWGSMPSDGRTYRFSRSDDFFRVPHDYKSVGLLAGLPRWNSPKIFAEAPWQNQCKGPHPQEWKLHLAVYVKDMLRNGDRVDRTVVNIKSAAFSAWYSAGTSRPPLNSAHPERQCRRAASANGRGGRARVYITTAPRSRSSTSAACLLATRGKGLEEEARLIQDLVRRRALDHRRIHGGECAAASDGGRQPGSGTS